MTWKLEVHLGVGFNEPVQVQKLDIVIIESDCETTRKKITDSSCLFTRSVEVRKVKQR